MIRQIFSSSLFIVTACATQKTETISSMNYLMEPIKVSCVRTALLEQDGFSVIADVRNIGGSQQFDATFNDDLPLKIIVRTQADGTGEVSVFSRISADASPLKRREAAYAVEAADETIYRQCTADGKINPDDADVIIEAQE